MCGLSELKGKCILKSFLKKRISQYGYIPNARECIISSESKDLPLLGLLPRSRDELLRVKEGGQELLIVQAETLSFTLLGKRN